MLVCLLDLSEYNGRYPISPRDFHFINSICLQFIEYKKADEN